MFYDWQAFFWPQMQTPWVMTYGMYNMPWLWVVLQPLRGLGRFGLLAVVLACLIVSITLLSARLGLSAWRYLMVLCSAPVCWCILMGQIDGLILLAYVLPPGLAVFLGMTKPQVALGAVVNAFRRRPLLVCVVGAVLLVSSYIIWRWPLQMLQYQAPHNAPSGRSWLFTVWPWGLVLVPWLFKDLRRRLAASPLVMPHAGLQSLLGPILFAATLPAPLFIAIWAFLWWRMLWMFGVI
jgi:hypothetical protein